MSINKKASNTAVLILSHLMDENGVLNDETKARTNRGLELFKEGNLDFIITSGWAYRSDINTPIASIVKDYLVSKFAIESERVIEECNARDTVGDAIFFKLNVLKSKVISKLNVVSSQYHIDRVQEIFYFFLEGQCELEFHAIPTTNNKVEQILENERKSLDAFRSTFTNVMDAHSDVALSILSSEHPYYNGDIFPRIKF